MFRKLLGWTRFHFHSSRHQLERCRRGGKRLWTTVDWLYRERDRRLEAGIIFYSTALITTLVIGFLLTPYSTPMANMVRTILLDVERTPSSTLGPVLDSQEMAESDPPRVEDDKSLRLSAEANPSSGPTPLSNVSLAAQVAGTLTGSITYRFDCTNNGDWDHEHTTVEEAYVVENLCSYEEPGWYSARVRAERDGTGSVATVEIRSVDETTDYEADSLLVDVEANPSWGVAPLRNVDLVARVSGTSVGPITYRFDCTSDGQWDHEFTTVSETYTAVNLCDYDAPGPFSARIAAERDGLSVTTGSGIMVESMDSMSERDQLRLSLSARANPSRGSAPLLDVDLIAMVYGTAEGPYIYRFDCISNGEWDHEFISDQQTHVAENLCSYEAPGLYNATVAVEHAGRIVETTIEIVSSGELH
jgi:hypothetical protein